MVGIVAALVSVTWKISMPNLAVAGLALVLVIFSGVGLPSLPNSQGSPRIKVAAMQGGVSWPIGPTYAHPGTILSGHLAQARTSDLRGTQVVLWGEQAADIDLRSDAQWAEELRSWQENLQIPVIFGTLAYGEKTTSNQVLKLEDGKLSQIYTKREPVPFGEFLPGRPIISKLFPKQVKMLPRDMVPGESPGVTPVGNARIGANICFEVAIDALVRDTVHAGANLLYFPTNNSSFGYSYQSRQQLQIARFRALEYDRSSVQIAVGGVSALINPDGQVVSQSGLFRADTLKATLPLRDTLTWQARFGGTVNSIFRFGTLIGLALVAAALIFLKIQKRSFQGAKVSTRPGHKMAANKSTGSRKNFSKGPGKK